MEKTRLSEGAPGWLWVNLAALGFSLVHAIGDFGLLIGLSSSGGFTAPQALLTLLIGLLYSWWGWVFAKAVAGARSGFVGLMAFAIGWVLLGNGSTIIYCLPPCGSAPFFADVMHIGNLIFGPLAALFAYRAMRRTMASSSRLAVMSNIVIMLVLLVALFGLEASLVNA